MAMRTLLVHLDADDDQEGIDRLTGQLRQELLELDVADVRRETADSPVPGAKGDAVSVGTLVVSLADSVVLTALVTGVCQVLRAWVTRHRDRRVVLKDGDRSLELTGVSVEQHERAIEAFLKTLDGQAPRLDDDRGRNS
jgi:hypothetical protein